MEPYLPIFHVFKSIYPAVMLAHVVGEKVPGHLLIVCLIEKNRIG